ncbi:uncharacterized protein EMH_0045030 [Eimeria mitis]|uniref:Uncharacterized protein n=1 Tax=Eimeria mitis TaxID=44415 RepID=U6JU37_9EIME|nr:uncharacterized protein EMH_0045030 [Eimeria mitis]CDJ28904.1 hypothetical protein, conserved [Eimeria mitis]
MCGGPAGIAEDGAVKTYMLDYDHGFTAPMISRKSRMPHRSLHIISYAMVATVVIFLVVQCALQLAGRRNVNGWSQRRLAEQVRRKKGKLKGSVSLSQQHLTHHQGLQSLQQQRNPMGKKHRIRLQKSLVGIRLLRKLRQLQQLVVNRQSRPKLQRLMRQAVQRDLLFLQGGKMTKKKVKGCQGLGRHRRLRKERDLQLLIEKMEHKGLGVARKGRESGEQPADVPGAEGAWADPGEGSAGSTHQLVFPWLDLSAVGATGGESGEQPADVPEQLPWQRMPDEQGPERPAWSLDTEEPSGGPGTSQGTTEEPGHPAQQLPGGAKGAWADPGARSTGTTQQLVFELVDMSGVSGKGGESGERPEDVPEQLPWQPMTDLQAPERPAGSPGAEEPGQEPAESQEPTAAPAVRESGGALTGVQGKQSSGDNWGTGEASAPGEMPHPSAGASQQTTASAVTQAGGPLVAGLKRVATSAAGALESFFQPDFPAGWMYAFPLIGDPQTREDMNTVLRFLQSAGSQPRPPHPGRFRIKFRGFSIEITVSHTVSSPGWPGERILQAAAIFMENFFADVTALFETGDSRPVIEKTVELKTEAGSNIAGCLTIRLVEETHTNNCKA